MKDLENSITEAILCSDTIEDKRVAIKEELEKYQVHTWNWDKYCHFLDETYTRNAVIHNDVFTILILCWEKECKSVIHDHPCDGCFIVGIDGTLEETKFAKRGDEKELVEVGKNIVKKGDIAWMHDYLGFHRVTNPSTTERAVTLHVYHPPFNVCKGYKLDGENWNCTPKFHTINGEKVENN